MDNPFTPWDKKYWSKIYQNVAAFAVRFRLYRWKENAFSE